MGGLGQATCVLRAIHVPRASTSHLCRNTQGSCPAAVILQVSEPGNLRGPQLTHLSHTCTQWALLNPCRFMGLIQLVGLLGQLVFA